jgi:hypothetical protein
MSDKIAVFASPASTNLCRGRGFNCERARLRERNRKRDNRRERRGRGNTAARERENKR